jgi:hypothetical protein
MCKYWEGGGEGGLGHILGGIKQVKNKIQVGLCISDS